MRRFIHSDGQPTSECRFRQTCHFHYIQQMSPHSARLKQMYCIERPEKCAVYMAKAAGRSVPITLWLAGKLRAGER